MNKSILNYAVTGLILLLVSFSTTNAQIENILKKLQNKNKSNTNDTETVISGLKEALEIGTGNAVDVLSVTDGYFGNKLVKILLPDELKKVEPMLRNIGLNRQVDEFILTMNRAAESAAKEATPIFLDAIKGITFDDAMKILNGGDNAATNYFREKTSKKLGDKFKPIINDHMDKVGVTKAYKEITQKVNSNPFVKVEKTDLDSYVTNQALDGMFTVIAQEEAKIRKDPAAQVTDLLKQVFGSGG